jgi:lantibiotic modifying enzyme
MLSALVTADNEKVLIKEILHKISEAIDACDIATDSYGLLSGLAGELLFQFEFNKFTPGGIDENVFTEKLNLLQDQLYSHVNHLNLGRGLLGQSWFIELLNQSQGEAYDEDLCEDIDRVVIRALSIDVWPGEIELVLGLGGFSVYASRRYKKSKNSQMMELIVSHFENLAINTSDIGVSWSQPINSVYRFEKSIPDKLEFNLGLAHGIPSIIASLLPALKIPELYDRAKKLLTKSCNWLMQQELEPKLSDHENKVKHSCFSSFCTGSNNMSGVDIDPSDYENNTSRLGWCYGDLTVALTLARVGKALGNVEYLDKALEISLHAAQRNHISGAINDAGLCHGSAGLALIFQLLYEEIEAPELLLAANMWVKFTLELYKEKGIEGLYAFLADNKKYVYDTSFLTGLSGIGLCLLSALGQEADWADCLLMA